MTEDKIFPVKAYSFLDNGDTTVTKQAYIRADLVDELVGALEGVLPFTLVGKSDDAWKAIDTAIKTLEKIKEET